MKLCAALLVLLAGCSDTCDDPCPEGTVCVADRCRTPCVVAADCSTDQICFRGYCETGDTRPDRTGDGEPASGDPATGDPATGDPATGDPATGDNRPAGDSSTCGNNEVESGERCDGTDLAGRINCTDFNWASGAITCMITCMEFDLSTCVNPPGQCGTGSVMAQQQCDTDDLNGESCTTLGFAGGDLACNSNCSFDITGCTP